MVIYCGIHKAPMVPATDFNKDDLSPQNLQSFVCPLCSAVWGHVNKMAGDKRHFDELIKIVEEFKK